MSSTTSCASHTSQGFRVWRLATRAAHSLHERAGFRRVANPDTLMEINDRDVYLR
jgi:hypothetical protein